MHLRDRLWCQRVAQFRLGNKLLRFNRLHEFCLDGRVNTPRAQESHRGDALFYKESGISYNQKQAQACEGHFDLPQGIEPNRGQQWLHPGWYQPGGFAPIPDPQQDHELAPVYSGSCIPDLSPRHFLHDPVSRWQQHDGLTQAL